MLTMLGRIFRKIELNKIQNTKLTRLTTKKKSKIVWQSWLSKKNWAAAFFDRLFQKLDQKKWKRSRRLSCLTWRCCYISNSSSQSKSHSQRKIKLDPFRKPNCRSWKVCTQRALLFVGLWAKYWALALFQYKGGNNFGKHLRPKQSLALPHVKSKKVKSKVFLASLNCMFLAYVDEQAKLKNLSKLSGSFKLVG